MSEHAFPQKPNTSPRSTPAPSSQLPVGDLTRPTASMQQHILMLQRLVGNQAVLRMVRSGEIAQRRIQRDYNVSPPTHNPTMDYHFTPSANETSPSTSLDLPSDPVNDAAAGNNNNNGQVRIYKDLKERGSRYRREAASSRASIEEVIDGVTQMVQTTNANLQNDHPPLNLEAEIKKALGWEDAEVQKYLRNNKLLDDITPKVEYFGDERADERRQYEVQIAGSLTQAASGQPFHTGDKNSVFSGKGYAIYVMSQDGKFYSDSHRVGLFHHSSFLGGGDVAGAGEWKVEAGVLKEINNKSGHYKPSPVQLVQTLVELEACGVNLGGVRIKLLGADGTLKDAKTSIPQADGTMVTKDLLTAAEFLSYNRHIAQAPDVVSNQPANTQQQATSDSNQQVVAATNQQQPQAASDSNQQVAAATDQQEESLYNN